MGSVGYVPEQAKSEEREESVQCSVTEDHGQNSIAVLVQTQNVSDVYTGPQENDHRFGSARYGQDRDQQQSNYCSENPRKQGLSRQAQTISLSPEIHRQF